MNCFRSVDKLDKARFRIQCTSKGYNPNIWKQGLRFMAVNDGSDCDVVANQAPVQSGDLLQTLKYHTSLAE
jgi:hypothetical protein